MELNKCNRCGSFFMATGNVCPACSQKDSADIIKLENYMQEFDFPENIDEIACNTGISVQNLNRHFAENPEFSNKFKLDV